MSNSISFNSKFCSKYSKRLGKKAGVTTYIIIGLVILIVASVAIFIVTRETSLQSQREREAIQRLPSEVQPVALMVDQCLRDITKQGTELIGMQGGRLSLDSSNSNSANPASNLVFGYYSTESDGVSFTKDKNSPKIPYWYYLSSPSDCLNCKFVSNSPSISEMEKELSNYINTNLNNCLNDFESFKEQYEIEVLESPKSRVSIGDSLSVSLKYPLKVRTFSGEFSHSDFSATLNVNLKRMHELATQITDYEIDNSFIERIIFNLISAHASINSQLPPIAGTELGFDKSIWVKTLVRNNVQDMIRDSFFLLTVPGTRNFFPGVVDTDEPGVQLKQGYLYSMVVPILGDAVYGSEENNANIDTNTNANANKINKYDSVDVNFFYFDWPIYFDVTPNEGEIIRPEELGTDFLGFLPFGSQSYEFSYDLAVPVVVELRDAEAFNGEGYSFMFALEGNIRDNAPFKDQDYEILNSLGDEGTSLFSNPSQRISGEITVQAIDNEDLPLKDASVQYICGDNSAYIGVTSNDGILKSKFPICNGGIVQLYKEGYLKANSPLTTRIGVDDSVSGKLYKLYDVDANVNVVRPDTISQLSNLATGSLSPSDYDNFINNLLFNDESELNNEEVIFTISRVADTPFDDSYVQILYLQDNSPQKLTLAEGSYEVKATYLDNNGVIINASTKTITYCDELFCDGTLVKKKEKSIPLPEIPLNPAPLGGVSLDVNTGYWVVGNDKLSNSNGVKKSVTLFVIRSEDPVIHEDLANIGNYEQLSGQYRNLVEPRWG